MLISIRCLPLFLLLATPLLAENSAQSSISGQALPWINAQITADQASFYVYKDSDSGLNHGFSSGWFPDPKVDPAALTKLHLDTACLYDPTSANRCATDTTKMDQTRGTVLRVTFDPLAPGEYVGFHFEEPQGYITNFDPNTNSYSCSGASATPHCPPRGYDLRGATQVCFDVLSPTPNLRVLFGVNGKPAAQANGQPMFLAFSNQWSHQCLDLSTFGLTQSDLQSVHYLFMVESNDQNAPLGGTILLDNIRFLPVPTAQANAVSFPQANEVFGVAHASNVVSGRVSIPPDQVLSNLTTTYESALAELAMLAGGKPAAAKLIADAFVAALNGDNQGDPLPKAPDGSSGIHNGMFSGDLLLYNDQGPGEGLQGQVRLSGFSLAAMPDGSYSNLCGPSHFCLVLDGATGGNAAFAIIALAEAYRWFNDQRYLNAARTIGNWIYGTLLDNSGSSFGGYFAGFPDEGILPKTVEQGKSIENNADIFRAFTTLATHTRATGSTQEAAEWDRRAAIAGDFVMNVYDTSTGHFFAGTAGTGKQETIDPTPFLDAQTFVTLALADSPRYRDAIDWRAPMQWMLNNFAVSVSTSPNAPGGSQSFDGLNLVTFPAAGPNAVAWEFTSQAVVALRLVDRIYGEQRFEAQAQHLLAQIAKAQQSAPFEDGAGVVASTMDQGDALPPYLQCESTPYQCIAERVGLAATSWAVFADLNVNPFEPIAAANAPSVQAIVDAASYQSALSPGSLFSVFGTNFAMPEQKAVGTPLPTMLGGASVTINGAPAPLLYAGPSQINGQIPYEISGGTAIVQVSVNGLPAPPMSVSINATAPRLFPGQANACIAQNEDGTLNSAGNPVATGHYVVSYLIGLGAANPNVATGAAAPVVADPQSLSRPTAAFSASLGNRNIGLAYLGLTPASVGLGQANLLIPQDMPSGLQGFFVNVGNAASNTCLIAVGSQPVAFPKPIITSITPPSGPAAGGTPVTISGPGFLAGLTVAFGSAKVLPENIRVINGNTIMVVTPAGSGSVSVTVSNPDGQSFTFPSGFVYQLPAPAPVSVTPNIGPSKGGSIVQISGSGFRAGLTVIFGGSAATNVQVNNGGTIIATTPPGTGIVDITVKNSDGQSGTLSKGYTYVPAPTISGATPNPVNYIGGTTVTITGTGFLSGLEVAFGTMQVPSAGIKVSGTTTVQVPAPSALAGTTVNITITNPDGQTATFSNFTFTKPDASHATITGQVQACSVSGSVTGAVIPDAFRVTMYALTNQYYVQPCTTQTLSPIASTGAWGPIPSHGGAIYVLLVSAAYNPPAILQSLPPVDGVNVFAVTGPVGTLASTCDVAACPAQ